MSNTVTVERLALHSDARGWVCEPLGPDGLPGQRNVHMVLTEPGCVRGNHLHQRGTEVLTVVGPALFRAREGDRLRDVTVPEGEVYRITIPPGVAHAVRNTGSAPGVLVSFNTEEHVPSAPDVVRVVLIDA